ncbi:MAG: MaoC family dehydratase N-terminal domain-containing protein [Neomegalonema sp.]|nr:MaoC family dehydratase N-terminal domain-containing protein [Neomegalonema sp.]
MSDVAPTLDAERLAAWVGRTEAAHDVLDPRPLRLAASILPDYGDVLGPMRHWFYFLDAQPLDALGRDGHPARGGFLPPVALPRRMWAGGRLSFHGELRIGDDVEQRQSIASIALKQGRSGPLCFVTTRTEVRVDDQARVVEERDLVYRRDPAPSDPEPQKQMAPSAPAFAREVRPSSILLFRYSALTFNGHRIHYDLDYCRQVEGYPHLVVHGPLLATLLADLAVAQKAGRALRRFSYRAISPLCADAAFMLEGAPASEEGALSLWARALDGGLAMRAEAHFHNGPES